MYIEVHLISLCTAIIVASVGEMQMNFVNFFGALLWSLLTLVLGENDRLEVAVDLDPRQQIFFTSLIICDVQKRVLF